ncbi:hypothetical protein PISL3812_01479 [Talaromyces islandicus]|uniref:Uncharacterized protein n=1 Tax=Talaromyces islandicus TaxID=28573 RepID=A0A0U1LPP0_TALIS|nr:hypothetical protein PISL3812_01479 [Talaromyces islandicus]
MNERFDKLENEMARMRAEGETTRNQMAIIRSSELLKYLPFEKQVDSYVRNELVHGGDVRHDLRFLKSVGKEFLRAQGLHIADLENAFEKRYGNPPKYFNTKDFPPAIEWIINIKSSLEHLRVWKDVDEQYVAKRDRLKSDCDRVIRLWFGPAKGLPYSIEDANLVRDRICKEYDSTIVSMQDARAAKRGGERKREIVMEGEDVKQH